MPLGSLISRVDGHGFSQQFRGLLVFFLSLQLLGLVEELADPVHFLFFDSQLPFSLQVERDLAVAEGPGFASILLFDVDHPGEAVELPLEGLVVGGGGGILLSAVEQLLGVHDAAASFVVLAFIDQSASLTDVRLEDSNDAGPAKQAAIGDFVDQVGLAFDAAVLFDELDAVDGRGVTRHQLEGLLEMLLGQVELALGHGVLAGLNLDRRLDPSPLLASLPHRVRRLGARLGHTDGGVAGGLRRTGWTGGRLGSLDLAGQLSLFLDQFQPLGGLAASGICGVLVVDHRLVELSAVVKSLRA